MSGDFKRSNIAGSYIAPESTQGVPIWDRVTTSSSAAANELIDAAIPGVAADYPANVFGIYIVTGPLAGELALVASYDQPNTKWVLDRNLSGIPGSGVQYYLAIRVPAKGKVDDDIDKIPRDFDTQQMDKLSHQVGFPNAPVTLDSELPGLLVPAGDGVTPTKDAFSFMLDCLGDRRVVPGVLVDAGASTTVIPVKTAPSVTGHQKGDYVFINGEFRRIASVSNTPDQFTLERALSAIPAEDDVSYGTEVWTPKGEGQDSITVLHILDDQLIEAKGAVLSVKGSMNWGQLPLMTLEGMAEDWNYTDNAAIKGILPTNIPTPLMKGECVLYVPKGSGPPEVLALNSAEFDFGHSIEPVRDSDSGSAYKVIDRNSKIDIKFRNKNANVKTWEKNAQKCELMMQGGNVAGNAILLVSHCQIDSAKREDDAGHSWWGASLKQIADSSEKMTLVRA